MDYYYKDYPFIYQNDYLPSELEQYYNNLWKQPYIHGDEFAQYLKNSFRQTSNKKIEDQTKKVIHTLISKVLKDEDPMSYIKLMIEQNDFLANLKPILDQRMSNRSQREKVHSKINF